ncbi:MAG: helix-turn-helix domain-containing protein [Oscillospiraceae bacterium]|jgi:transcriptional regulator with XRE-family HTH domain|nr:helix-turn-helix domain-containing protein [Oscillospiraceae bacterium]
MNRIRELRKEKELTQTQLARMMKVSQGTLSYWERGDFEPDYDALKWMADFFQVSTDYLLCRTDEPSFFPARGGAPLHSVYLRLARDAQEKRLPEEAIRKMYELMEQFRELNRHDES